MGLFSWFILCLRAFLFFFLRFAIIVQLLTFPFNKHFRNCTFHCSWDGSVSSPWPCKNLEFSYLESTLLRVSRSLFSSSPTLVAIYVGCSVHVGLWKKQSHSRMLLAFATMGQSASGELTTCSFAKGFFLLLYNFHLSKSISAYQNFLSEAPQRR